MRDENWSSSGGGERPIFLFGVGRCGSTFLQLQLSRMQDVWIWGEHDGILRNLLDWGKQTHSLKELSQYSFGVNVDDMQSFIAEPFQGNATHLAWLNGFKAEDVDDAQRSAVRLLMRSRIPAGKSRWGFKEIRYGIDDDVPRDLLKLFPEAKLIHTVRHPRKIIESAIVEWGGGTFANAVRAQDVDAALAIYQPFAVRWIKLCEYFKQLKLENPQSVFESHLERGEVEGSMLCSFLQLDFSEFVRNKPGRPINPSGIHHALQDPDFARMFNTLWLRTREQLAPMMRYHMYEDERF